VGRWRDRQDLRQEEDKWGEDRDWTGIESAKGENVPGCQDGVDDKRYTSSPLSWRPSGC
jgi:hypothetical protein